jgi:predicted transcriptional regulator
MGRIKRGYTRVIPPDELNTPVNAPANASVKLSKTQIAIVKAIINNNHVTYDDLKTILGVDRSTICRIIHVMIKCNWSVLIPSEAF